MFDRIAYAVRASRAFATQPRDAVERTLEKVAERRDLRAGDLHYPVEDAPEEGMHRLVGADWPCSELDGFEAAWESAAAELRARHLRMGRGAFGGWDDGDRRFVRFAWCVARHLRPNRVIETGVARGLTTAVLLDALEQNVQGHLWSVDLPPLLEVGLSDETGAAVSERLCHRWTLVRGSSRRVLPGLVNTVGRIELFVHDSMHTTRNVNFELECVWPALAPGGVILIDDVEKNAGMAALSTRHPDARSMICAADDGEALIGAVVKPG